MCVCVRVLLDPDLNVDYQTMNEENRTNWEKFNHPKFTSLHMGQARWLENMRRKIIVLLIFL